MVPPPVTPPAGTPIPQQPALPTDKPCDTFTSPALTISNGQTFFRGGGPFGTSFGVINASSLHAAFTNATVTGGGLVIKFTIQFQTDVPSFTTLQSIDHFVNPGVTLQADFAIYPGAKFYAMDINGFSGTGTAAASAVVTTFCNGQQAGGTQSPCCPPDAVTAASIAAILSTVTLLQRQIAPFGTIPGASHVGLTGSGQFAVQGIIGLSVTLTTTPTVVGVEAGDPNALFGAGWINVGTADGWGPRQFISSSPMILELIPGNITLVGYSLMPGVVATISEIVREP